MGGPASRSQARRILRFRLRRFSPSSTGAPAQGEQRLGHPNARARGDENGVFSLANYALTGRGGTVRRAAREHAVGNLHAGLRKAIHATSKSVREPYDEQRQHCRGCPADGGHVRGRPRRRPDKLPPVKAYDTTRVRRCLRRHEYTARIARIGMNSSERPGRRRRVVERTIF